MKFQRVLLRIGLLVVPFCAAAWGQDTGSITGTVKDPSGAAVAGPPSRSPVPIMASSANSHQLCGRLQRVRIARRSL